MFKLIKSMITAVALALCMGLSCCDSTAVTEITRFTSPDGEYLLIFQQVGDPVFPFGETTVRLQLDKDERTVNSLTCTLQDDGKNACEDNVSSVQWLADSVTVILQASEMDDMTVTLLYQP